MPDKPTTEELACTLETEMEHVGRHNNTWYALKRAAARLRALEAENKRLREGLGEYLYETTHLATPETVGGREYRKTLIPYSVITQARAMLAAGDYLSPLRARATGEGG